METQLIKITDENREQLLARAAELLQGGQVVAIPTETVYGLAASALNADAVHEVYNIKGRPADNPLIVHISDLIMLKSVVAELPPDAVALAKAFWPGPLTIVLKKTPEISDVVTCGLDTVAVRMPSQPTAAALIERTGLPLAAPSANLSGRPSPTTARHVFEDLNGKLPLIIDDGPCEVGVESTVITLVADKPIVLRPGIISIDQIRAVLPEAIVSPAIMTELTDNVRIESPGMKYRHYAPRADLTLVKGTLEQFRDYVGQQASGDIYAMCFDGEEEQIDIPAVSYGPIDRPDIQARRLFAVLRAVDLFGASRVYVRAPSEEGLSMAVYNRLIRAADHKVVEL